MSWGSKEGGSSAEWGRKRVTLEQWLNCVGDYLNADDEQRSSDLCQRFKELKTDMDETTAAKWSAFFASSAAPTCGDLNALFREACFQTQLRKFIAEENVLNDSPQQHTVRMPMQPRLLKKGAPMRPLAHWDQMHLEEAAAESDDHRRANCSNAISSDTVASSDGCDACGAADATLRCGRCRRVLYCNQHW